jgi:molybdopterin-guanine dinucleotide biosynthesis protein A
MAGRSDLTERPTFAGAVLTGGSSRRMGTDKALLVVDRQPLAVRVASALRAAGADRVVAVGGDLPALRELGLDAVLDLHAGEGPLGGILTALDATIADVVVVLACDLPGADPAAITAVVDALGEADVAAPLRDGRHELLHAAYRRRTQPVLAAAFAAGERAVHRACRALDVVSVTGLADGALADADTPEQLGLDAPDANQGGAGSG